MCSAASCDIESNLSCPPYIFKEAGLLGLETRVENDAVLEVIVHLLEVLKTHLLKGGSSAKTVNNHR